MTQYRPPLLNLPPVVKNILIINVLMLLATTLIGSKFGVDLDQYLALYFPKAEQFRPHQFITYMFMHADFYHLLFNMFAVFMFGRVLESVWGSKRFLSFYLITGIGAALTHLAIGWFDYSAMKSAAEAFINTPNPELFISFAKEYFPVDHPIVMNHYSLWMDDPTNIAYINKGIQLVNEMIAAKISIPTVGASGAVFGILLAFGMLFPNTELMLLFPPIPIKAKYFVIGYGVLELFMGVQNQTGDNVAHFAHLGGMLFGFILIKYWQKNSKRFY